LEKTEKSHTNLPVNLYIASVNPVIMAWVVVLAVIFGLLTIILWLPLELEIDSQKDVYRAAWSRIIDFRMIPDEKGLNWVFRVFNKKINISNFPQKSAPEQTKPVPKNRSPFPTRLIWLMLKNLPRAFRIKHFRINWDTGDFIRNAHLYPLFYLWSNRRMQLGINFVGQQEVAIFVQTRLFSLAQAFLRAYFSYKFK
jgi:hypothetical protein